MRARAGRQLLFKLTLLLITVAVLLAVMEAVVRRRFPQTAPALPEEKRFWRPDEVLGWSLIPGKEGVWDVTGEYAGRVAINRSGFRDSEYPIQKPEGTMRILVLGDSFVEGLQVDLEKTFHKVLERQLNECQGDSSYQILAMGVAGFGTTQEYLLLERYGWALSPDIVILAFLAVNDIYDNSLALEQDRSNMVTPVYQTIYRPYFIREGNGELELVRRALASHRRWSLGSRWRTYALAEKSLAKLKRSMVKRRTGKAPVPPDLMIYHPSYPPEWEEAMAVTLGVMDRMNREAAERGAHLVIVSLTQGVSHLDGSLLRFLRGYEEAAWDLDKPDRIVAQFAAPRGIPFVGLTEAFRRLMEEDQIEAASLHFPVDGHWTPEGHERAATVIHEALISNGLVDACSRRAEGLGDGRP